MNLNSFYLKWFLLWQYSEIPNKFDFKRPIWISLQSEWHVEVCFFLSEFNLKWKRDAPSMVKINYFTIQILSDNGHFVYNQNKQMIFRFRKKATTIKFIHNSFACSSLDETSTWNDAWWFCRRFSFILVRCICFRFLSPMWHRVPVQLSLLFQFNSNSIIVLLHRSHAQQQYIIMYEKKRIFVILE